MAFQDFDERRQLKNQREKLTSFIPQEEVSQGEGANPISPKSVNIQEQNNRAGEVVAKMASKQPQKFVNPVVQEISQMTPQEQTRVVASTTSQKDMDSVIDNAPGEQSVKNQVKKIFNTPPLLKAKQEDIANKNSEGKPLGLVDSFVESLSFFLPTAIGAVIGGIGGGTEGAVEGADTATNLAGSYRNFQAQNADRNLKQQELQGNLASKEANALINASNLDTRRNKSTQAKIDLTPDFMDVKTGQPVSSRQTATGFEFINAAGQVIPGENVQSIKQNETNARQKLALEDRQIARVEQTQNSFMKRKDIAEGIELIGTSNKLNSMLDSGEEVTEAFISTWVAKGIQGQKGVLTEDDIKRAGIPMDKWKKIKSGAREYFLGGMDEDKIDITKRLTKAITSAQQRELNSKIEGFANDNRANRLKIDKGNLRQDLKDLLGLESDKESNVKPVNKQEISKDKSEKVSKIRGLLKGGK